MEKFDLKKNPNDSIEKQKFFLNYINLLEGSKTACKAMHWGVLNLKVSDKRGTHLYLDDFLEIVSDFQDRIAESSQGILGTFLSIKNVKGLEISTETPKEFISYIQTETNSFYEMIPEDSIYQGIKSETEVFILDLNKYMYLFTLTE